MNNIGQITLEKNVELGLKSPTNEIGEFTSNGGTLSSPSNKLVLYGGLPLSVLSNKEVTENGVTVTKEVYGKVSGYTILQTDNGKYGGAFAYGSKESTGTFVILKDGNYVESLTRDYSNPECRCWYIAGNVTYVTTIVADGKKANDSDTFVKYPNKIVGIPIQNTDSQLVYTGFDKKVPVNDRFNLVESVKDYPDFSMKVYGDGGSVTSNGIQLSDKVPSIGSDYANYVMSVPNKLPSATIELTSSTNLTYTGLVATITIHLKEMRGDNGAYHVVNSIDIIVNIHTEATSFPMDDPYDVVIGTRNGKGEAEFIIKRLYQGYTALIESIEGADLFSKITMESHLNKEGTLGWATPLSGKIPMSTISAGGFIGELTGSFSATIKFTSNYDTANGVPVSVAEVKIKLSNGNDDKKITYPKFSVEGKEIVVKANDGYASVLNSTSPSLPEFPPLPFENGPYAFKMPKSKVELTINVSVIEFELVIDFDGGAYNGSNGPIIKKISYFGIYDVDSIQESLIKNDCTFGGWGLWKRTGDNNYEYIGTIVHGQSIAIYADQMLKAIWIDKEKYTIEYYLMNLDGVTYAHHSTEIGSSDPGKVTIYPKKINGFKGPESVEFDIVEGGNNNFIIKYEREKYTVKFNINYQDNFYDSFNEIVEKVFFDEMISKILPMEKIKPGFEVKDGSVIDKVPVPDEGTTVEIPVYATKITYRIDYNLGDNWILKEELKQYVISNEEIKLPEAERSGYEFKGWKNTNNDVWYSIPQRGTGDLILTPNYSKLPVITIINWEVVSVTSDHFVKQSNGIYVSKNSDGGSVTFKYENGDETVYKWIINGEPVDSSGNQCGFEVKEDTTVFAYPKLRDVNTDPAPLDVMRITLAFTKNVNGVYSATIDGSLKYDGFTIDLKKYGGTGENPSIQFTDKEVNIKGLAGMTGALFIKESSMKYNVEITLYIISNISDSDLRGTSTITINDGRSNVLDSQTFSDYILPSEGGEVIE